MKASRVRFVALFAPLVDPLPTKPGSTRIHRVQRLAIIFRAFLGPCTDVRSRTVIIITIRFLPASDHRLAVGRKQSPFSLSSRKLVYYGPPVLERFGGDWTSPPDGGCARSWASPVDSDISYPVTIPDRTALVTAWCSSCSEGSIPSASARSMIPRTDSINSEVSCSEATFCECCDGCEDWVEVGAGCVWLRTYWR